MTTLKDFTPEELEEHFSNFLISSWSYSKVSGFARNEKAFEMNYIYGISFRNSAASIAGNAYHTALQYFFTNLQLGKTLDLVELEASAFQYLDGVPANTWKVQKTTPTVEDCQKKASKIASDLLRNFISEIDTYLKDEQDPLAEVLEVEVYMDEYLTINGVEIPLPCHGRLDLVIRTETGKRILIDHKSKSAFSDDEEIKMTIGEQAITYVKLYESKTGRTVDEVWFIENKYSKNKDNSRQLMPFKVVIDENSRRLYEALLYEPLKRMIEAVNDPDYVYLINKNDNFVDLAEVYDFWARTMICEVEDFNVDAAKKGLVSQRLRKIRDASLATITPSVIKTFREQASSFINYDLSNKNMSKEEKIEHVLRSFGTVVQVAHRFEGFSSDTFLLQISAGVRVASIYSHRLDIANALDVANVRISTEMVMHEGKSYLAVEIAKKRDKSLFYDEGLLSGAKIPIGQDNFGNVLFWDLNNHATPHVLVCGQTGSGKSVFVQSTLEYCLASPVVEDIIVFDPKFEFGKYNGHKGIVVVSDILAIEEHMAKMVDHMNELVRNGQVKKTLIIFDEFADAVANSRQGNELRIYEDVWEMTGTGKLKSKRQHTGDLKSLEQNLKLILQKGRSAGMRVMAATQRASVKVISGDAKVNFPVQVCFRVPKEADSRVVLDEAGAEALCGMGDGLIKSPEYNQTVRFQAFYKPAATLQ